jgi:uncharacterized membrane protein
MWFSTKAAIISLYILNHLIIVMEVHYFYSDVENNFVGYCVDKLMLRRVGQFKN